MAGSTENILKAAQAGFDAQRDELKAALAVQASAVIHRTANGSSDLDESFGLDRAFRLVFVRCHFSGTTGSAELRIALDAAAGDDFDALLYTIIRAGTGRDVNFRIPAAESAEPSPWTFQAGDAVRVTWTNPAPGSITWGIEVGLALASG